ncbi:MAG: NUDIX domain-containing protein [Prevotellaceae bacterium]|jgi:8-oxo-dGTP pyrophosphatase MutT (NUDIX family)|nr:NUDIX domain-containing protein [Prevotellaceae bacterium]
MKKIFFNDRFIAFSCDARISEIAANADVNTLSSLDRLPDLFRRFLYRSTEKELYVICNNEDETFVTFCDLFDMIFTGGGLVRNLRGDVLLIYRYEHWDLPKGKQESGENITDTAIREVEEECGISNIKLGDFLTETYHCYSFNGRLMMKRNFWYEMFCNAETLTPQTVEDIEKAEFIPVDKLSEYLNSAYASIREVFIAAGLIE